MMTAMPNSPGRGTRAGLVGVLGAGWLLIGLAAWVYAGMKSIPAWAAVPVAAAFLIEIPFYLLPSFAPLREWLKRQGRVRGACLLACSALTPWVVYSLATGEERTGNFILLLAVAVVVSFWYIALPKAAITDALFLAAIGAVYLSKVFDRVYLSPIPKVSLSVLGHLMLIRTAALAVLVFRGDVKAEYRFVPHRSEWLAGLRYFGIMLPVIGLTYWALGLATVRPHPYGIGLAILTFLGMLWVVALSEEFFFRGLLQQWLENWTGNQNAALIIAALLFGSAHLGFHRIFPNWRWAIVAAILGLFCGLAWRNARSVQAAMVAHALVATIWQVFLR